MSATVAAGVPAGLILLLIVLVVVSASLGLFRARARAPSERRRARPRRRARLEPEPPPGEPPAAPVAECTEGEVRNEITRALAHETVAAGPIVVSATTAAGGHRQIEVFASVLPSPAEILGRLGADQPVALEVSIPLRIATSTCTTRDVCRGGAWVPEMEAGSNEGPVRVERLRARAPDRGELERFLSDVLGARARSLVEASRRLDVAGARCSEDDPQLS